MMTLIADSGSTKTAWLLIDGDQRIAVTTQGINPFHQSEADIASVLRHELCPMLGTAIDPIQAIYFYGAGCTPEQAPVVSQALRQALSPTARISVESDMLGAARGLCGHQSGIVCILGTGSNSAFYDGRQLHTGNPALGYILGDEGSGAYIGKRLVSDVLKHQLPSDLCQQFFDETHETQAAIIQKVYREPFPNRYLAHLSPFCARHRQHPAIHALLLDCFSQFFIRNILSAPWFDTLPQTPTAHFVGSIAYYYQKELAQAAHTCGIQLGTITQSPLEGLAEFHQ